MLHKRTIHFSSASLGIFLLVEDLKEASGCLIELAFGEWVQLLHVPCAWCKVDLSGIEVRLQFGWKSQPLLISRWLFTFLCVRHKTFVLGFGFFFRFRLSKRHGRSETPENAKDLNPLLHKRFGLFVLP